MVRTFTFYLPQFHPIAENDTWWGKGFTEWTNVTRARQLVRRHYQPHLPADLGFYDLRLPESRIAQANLAREHGIDGFCYYHYWFNGRRILNRPFDEVLKSGQPDFPFCLCWANENWTRNWDGASDRLLLEQRYSKTDDHAHIRFLLPIFADPRYVRIGGKPLFLVYRTELLPDPSQTADIWRAEAERAGLGEIFIARVESLASGINPKDIGFDAAVEFAPDWRIVHHKYTAYSRVRRLLSRLGLAPQGYSEHRFAEYKDIALAMRNKPDVPYRRYRCVTPGWDNSPRRAKNATILLNSTPRLYGEWLFETLRAELSYGRPENEQLVFVNAWNEWAEGSHLEPDQRWGKAYLEAHRSAVIASSAILP